jgi:CRP-like cAMP-binding protein
MSSHRIDRLVLSPEALRRVPLLSHLDDKALVALAQQMRFRWYPRQALVLNKGESGSDLMFLLAGRLQIVDVTEDGREIGLNIIEEGAFFGELAILDGQPRSASVVALSPSVVSFLPREAALRLCFSEPGVAEKMLRHFAHTIRKLSDFRSLLAISNAHKRVYALLCQVKRKKPDDPAGTEVIENLPTQQQIAIMINTSRETVSRAIARLVQLGILKKVGNAIVVQNPRQLEELVAEDKDG